MTENKSYCDICGEQIDLTREFELPKERVTGEIVNLKYDLCRECCRDLGEFIDLQRGTFYRRRRLKDE